MANTHEPAKPKTEGYGAGDVEGRRNDAATPQQGGSRDAANAMGRHSKEADHTPDSPAELHKAKGTEKPPS